MNYENFIQSLAIQCREFRRTSFQQSNGAWLYQQIQQGSQRYPYTPTQIYQDLVKLDSLKGIGFTNRPYYPFWFRASVFPKAIKTFLGSYFNLTTKLPQPPTHTDPIKTNTQKVASIVVLSYNRLDYLRTTLAALQATTDLNHHELIVVDNGSDAANRAFLREQTETGVVKKLILRSKNHGISPGYNCGFSYADSASDYLVKLDSDITILHPGWIDEFIAIFEQHPEIGILCLTVVNHPIVSQLPILTSKQPHYLASWLHWIAGGAGMTLPRKVFNQIGYFNEAFEFEYMPDDIDYYWRLCMAGYEAYYTKEMTAYHRIDLDYTKYKQYTGSKLQEYRDKSLRQQNKLALEYLLNQRNYKVNYKHYENCKFPPHSQIIEID